ncbi:MAG: GNAT family N-acetyltransferase [Rikenella sp.]|nr:GNAT family N-acetyltransferase [Rikenella sp.]
MIRNVRPASDAGAICGIYNHYIAETVITFETEPLETAAMQRRIKEISARFPYLVYEQDGRVLGYCYATTWHSRAAYDRTVEMSVYLHPDWAGKGIGNRLYHELIDRLRKSDFHVAVATITLPNTQSVALHENFGFRKVAHFTEVGYKFDKWLDVGCWELRL